MVEKKKLDKWRKMKLSLKTRYQICWEICRSIVTFGICTNSRIFLEMYSSPLHLIYRSVVCIELNFIMKIGCVLFCTTLMTTVIDLSMSRVSPESLGRIESLSESCLDELQYCSQFCFKRTNLRKIVPFSLPCFLRFGFKSNSVSLILANDVFANLKSGKRDKKEEP